MMRRLHQKFLAQRTMTDVLTFRYHGPSRSSELNVQSVKLFTRNSQLATSFHSFVLGEIVIAPAAARAYATQQGVSYRHELARYLAHGLLHWLGHQDRTPAEQRRMRAREDQLLASCAQ